MTHTIAEKILMRNTGDDSLRPGQIVTVHPDTYMVLDAYAPSIVKTFQEMEFEKIKCPEKVIVVLDHLLPIGRPENDVPFYNAALQIFEQYGARFLEKGSGICHSLMHQHRYALPGTFSTATDSHTTTYGGGGCFSTGCGYSEMAAILGTDEMWIRVPEAIKIVLKGRLPEFVTAKDVILHILGEIKADGGQYKSLEFTGDGASQLEMASRFTISNMSIEAGAKCALFEADEKTASYFGMDLKEISWIRAGEDDAYERVLEYDLSLMEPCLACPHEVDHVKPVRELEGTRVSEVYIGACTNGSLEDMRVAAEVLKGHRADPYTKLIICPDTNDTFLEAMNRGYIRTMLDAGAMVIHPCCGLCAGFPFGVLSDGDVLVSTFNRNFIGRQGSDKAFNYLASPSVAAASAINGMITDPRSLNLI